MIDVQIAMDTHLQYYIGCPGININAMPLCTHLLQHVVLTADRGTNQLSGQSTNARSAANLFFHLRTFIGISKVFHQDKKQHSGSP